MRKILARMVRFIVPRKLLALLFPARFVHTASDRRFVTIRDEIAGKSFKMYLREDSMMERLLVTKGLYRDWEKESLKIWAHLSKAASTIVDIGANTGVFTMVAMNNNPAATVVAIEPIDVNFGVLSKNIERNQFSVIAENVALSDVEGKAKMFMLKDRLNYMTSVNDNRYTQHPEVQEGADVVEIEVPIKPFSYIKAKHKLGKIDLVKIDVEGHEIKVLNAMLPDLKQSKPVMLIEIISDDIAREMHELFKTLGYRYVSINEQERSVVVTELRDNNHHNFLICHDDTIAYLRGKGLVS